jgi:hypothetical protein
MKCNRARSLRVALVLSMATINSFSAHSAPSTADFMNIMTVCGAGSTVNIDANLQGSIVSLYQSESTKGRAVQQITTEIAKLLPQGEVYTRYLACVKDLLSHP